MRVNYIILLTLIFLNSCTVFRSKQEWKKVKATCDIEKYQDFLIKYPRTRHIKEISDSLRLFYQRKSNFNGYSHGHGNCIRIVIKSDEKLFFRDSLINKFELKDHVKNSILNPDRLVYLPEFESVEIENLGTFEVSRAIFEIGTNEKIGSNTYSKIIETVKESVIEIRNDVSLNVWGKGFQTLDSEEKNQIELVIPLRLRFESFDIDPPEPPLPPEY